MSALRTTLPLLVLYFVSSSSLLVLNKVAIKAIPNASLLLFTQLGSTVVIVAAPALVGQARIYFKPEGKVVTRVQVQHGRRGVFSDHLQ